MTNTAHHGERAIDDTLALDAWLQRPEVRIARRLGSLDRPTAAQLFAALDIGWSEHDAYEQALVKLIKDGNVEGDIDEDSVVRYRLVRELSPPVRRKTRPIGTGLEREEREGWFFWRGTWRPL